MNGSDSMSQERLNDLINNLGQFGDKQFVALCEIFRGQFRKQILTKSMNNPEGNMRVLKWLNRN